MMFIEENPEPKIEIEEKEIELVAIWDKLTISEKKEKLGVSTPTQPPDNPKNIQRSDVTESTIYKTPKFQHPPTDSAELPTVHFGPVAKPTTTNPSQPNLGQLKLAEEFPIKSTIDITPHAPHTLKNEVEEKKLSEKDHLTPKKFGTPVHPVPTNNKTTLTPIMKNLQIQRNLTHPLTKSQPKYKKIVPPIIRKLINKKKESKLFVQSGKNSTSQTGHTISGGNGHTVAEKCDNNDLAEKIILDLVEMVIELCDHPVTRTMRQPVGDKSDHPVDEQAKESDHSEAEFLEHPVQEYPMIVAETERLDTDHVHEKICEVPVRTMDCEVKGEQEKMDFEKNSSKKKTQPNSKFQARMKTIPDTSWLQNASNETPKFDFLQGARKKMQSEKNVTFIEGDKKEAKFMLNVDDQTAICGTKVKVELNLKAEQNETVGVRKMFFEKLVRKENCEIENGVKEKTNVGRIMMMVEKQADKSPLAKLKGKTEAKSPKFTKGGRGINKKPLKGVTKITNTKSPRPKLQAKGDELPKLKNFWKNYLTSSAGKMVDNDKGTYRAAAAANPQFSFDTNPCVSRLSLSQDQSQTRRPVVTPEVPRTGWDRTQDWSRIAVGLKFDQPGPSTKKHRPEDL